MNPSTIALNITGMTCDTCAVHVREALEKVPGVREAQVSYPAGTAQVTLQTETPVETLLAAVTASGYGAKLGSLQETEFKVR